MTSPLPSLASRYPRLAEYVRRLPRGLDSYPEAQMKLLPVRRAIADKPIPTDPALPAAIERLVSGPLLPSSWGSSAAVHGLLLVIADVHRMSDAQYVEWTLVKNRELLQEKVYSVLLSLASPTMLLRGASARWSTFHRGIDLVLERTDAHEASATVRYPSFLLNDLLARGLRFSVDAITERSTRLSATWR